jgi:diketogulonate reductase-like aldo/keto reductase
MAIPKSVRKEKIMENINIFDFELTQDEIRKPMLIDLRKVDLYLVKTTWDSNVFKH